MYDESVIWGKLGTKLSECVTRVNILSCVTLSQFHWIFKDNHTIQRVKTFKRLGKTLCLGGRPDLKIKVNSVNKIIGTIRKKLWRKHVVKVQFRLYKIITTPTHTSGSEI